MQRYPFHHLYDMYLWNVCLLLKTQESGKVVIGDQIQTNATFLHQTLPVNSQVFPALRYMWLYCCPLTVVAPVVLPGLAPHPWM